MAEIEQHFTQADSLERWSGIFAANKAVVLGKGEYLETTIQTSIDEQLWTLEPMDNSRAYHVPVAVSERVTALWDAGINFDTILWAESLGQQLVMGLIRVSATEAIWVKLGAWLVPHERYYMNASPAFSTRSPHRSHRTGRFH